MNDEITVIELSKLTDVSTNNLYQLIKRGVLPQGRKEGIYRYLPQDQCLRILAAHPLKGVYRQWKKRSKHNPLSWEDLK